MRNFVTMAKPVGSLCNMHCAYCYYLQADNEQDASVYRMKDEVLETYIRSVIEASPGPAVSFTWHGGEPTLAGIPFYEKAVSLQKKYLPKGWSVWNNMQTNGLLIDDDWCEFLKRNRFDIGLSIDGTRFVHDRYREDNGGSDTYERVRHALGLFQKHGIQPDLLCTVTADTAQNGRQVYSTLRRYHTGWIQFIPIIRRDASGSVTPDSVTPQLYGKFLKTVFREWFSHDLGSLNVQLFAETALVLSGKPANVCWLKEECGDVLVVEKDGTVYNCDHFVDRHHKNGNLMDTPMKDLVNGEMQKAFGARKKELPASCQECPWLFICHGGCPKDRFAENGEYYLCEGMKAYLEYAVPYLKQAMELSRQGYTSAQIMKKIKL